VRGPNNPMVDVHVCPARGEFLLAFGDDALAA
jgi:hypothetical protein